MNKKKILAVVIAAFAALILLTGCRTSGQWLELRLNASLAEDYLEDKYHRNFWLKDSGYVTSNGLFMEYTSDMWFEFFGGTTVYYDAENEEGKSIFYDDRQAKEISKAAIDEFFYPAFDEIGDVRIGSSDSSLYSAVIFNNLYKDYSFFHEYYDGNIKDYLKKEKLVATTEEWFYIVCNENEWENAFDICQKKIFSNLDANGFFNFMAVTEQGYRNRVTNHYEDGVFARLQWFGEKPNLYIQKYINVAENICICADDEEGFVLNEGDIVFVPVEGFGEFAGKKAYKPVFSDIVKSKCKYHDKYPCYIKVANDSNVDECKLYKYIPEDDESYVVAQKSNIVSRTLKEDYIYWLDEC